MNAAVHRRIACLRSQLAASAASAEQHPGQVRQPRWSVLTDAEQMRIIDVRIPPGARAEVRHEVATLRWPVASRPDLESPTPQYFEAGTTHTMENDSSEELREIVFELLSTGSTGQSDEVDARQEE